MRRVVALSVVLCCLITGISVRADSRPNVLLIAVDDMNDWLGCLAGHPDAASPNIDRLADRGVLFTNAHCQAPICNPSRTSIMYGKRPSSTGVYMNAPRPWTVRSMQGLVTLPRWFARHGYVTYTAGKIYHGSGLPDGDFDVVGPRPGQRQKRDKRLVPPEANGPHGLWDWGAQDYDESLFQDHIDATWAIDQLAVHASLDATERRPFLMAIGFYRPHVPFYVPQRVLQQIPLQEIDLPVVKPDDRKDLPSIVDRICVAPAAPPHDYFVRTGRWREAVQAYLACIRWTDEQVGRLMQALEASPFSDNTVVVLYSDHGFFLGEKQRWAKQALWERATRVPLIVVAPDVKGGRRCARPVELFSIYPTLTDLCGLSHNPLVEGRSLKPLLQNADADWPYPALTTHGRNNHAVRSDRFRYIRYEDGSQELYDHAADPHEWTNLAADGLSPDELRIVHELTQFFPQQNAETAESSQRKPRSRKGK